MLQLIVGNIISLIASIIMVYSGFLKQKNRILHFQTIQIGLSVLSNFVLGGISGAIINALCCVRNILYSKNKLTIKARCILIIVSIVIPLLFNNIGIFGLLPIISAVSYLLFMNVKDVVKFKILIILTMTMWVIHDIYINAYVSAAFEFMNIMANIISIIQIKNQNKNKILLN